MHLPLFLMFFVGFDISYHYIPSSCNFQYEFLQALWAKNFCHCWAKMHIFNIEISF